MYAVSEWYSSQKCPLCLNQLKDYLRPAPGDVGRARRRVKACCAAADHERSSSFANTRHRCGTPRLFNRDVSASIIQGECADRERKDRNRYQELCKRPS